MRASRVSLSRVKISVCDTGLGIEGSDLDKLFRAFSKIQNKEDFSLNAQGVGLGLLISNQLADLLNKSEGGITVTSKLKQGSEFSFSICDMKNEDDDEISMSSHRASNLNSPPIKLIKSTNQFFHSKSNDQKSSSLFSNTFQESEVISDVFKIDVSSDNCLEGQDNVESLKEERSGPIVDDNCTNIKRSSQTEKLLNVFSSKIQEKIILIKPKDKQIEKSITVLENSPSEVSREENIFSLTQDKTFSRSFTAVDSNSLIKKRVEKIKNNIENRRCTCPVALIIDDNDFNILSMKVHLKKFAMQCESALSGEIALQKIFKMHENSCCKFFKYIFLDLEMPGKNGLVIYKEISEFYNSFGGVESMIILNTGYSKSSDIVKEAISKGVKHILIKPITQMNLVELIDRL